MRRDVLVLAGAALAAAIACSDGASDSGAPLPPRASSSGVVRTPTTSSTSGSTSSSASSTTGGPLPEACVDRPYCGSAGCCPPGWRCLRDACVAPGIECHSDADCADTRYCDLDLREPRCFPRSAFCDEAGLPVGCVFGTCREGPNVALSNGTAACGEVSVYVRNEGRKTLPRGLILNVQQTAPAVRDGGADAAADAGTVVTVEAAVTDDGILPGEVIKVSIPFPVDPRGALEATVERDAGAAVTDCDPTNDFAQVFNGCAAVK